MAPPAKTPKMELLPPGAQGLFVGLIAQGVNIRESLRRTKKKFPKADLPAAPNVGSWLDSDRGLEMVEKARLKLREQATERSFADTRQQIDALVTTAERLFNIFLVTKDTEVLALIRLNGEVRETFKAIREAASPFQTAMSDVISSYEAFIATYNRSVESRPKEVRDKLSN